LLHCNIQLKGDIMFKNTPFEAIAKSMTDAAPKFNPSSMQDALKPAQDNLKAWADLAQSQAQEMQATLTEAVESMKAVKDPQAAFEAFKASAETGMALLAKNLKEASALSVDQFHGVVDAVEKAHPAPEAFASVAKGMKAAASTAESTLNSALEKGASVAPASKAKKTR
jgi:hypothetical protein